MNDDGERRARPRRKSADDFVAVAAAVAAASQSKRLTFSDFGCCSFLGVAFLFVLTWRAL